MSRGILASIQPGFETGEELADNPGPCRDVHLAHDEAHELFDRVGADLHALGNFLCCQPLTQMYESLALARTQMEPSAHLLQIIARPSITFHQERDERGGRPRV